MDKLLSKEEIEELVEETFDHLSQNRFKMGLSSAQNLYEIIPSDFRSATYLAWAYLENTKPNYALEYADLSVRLGKGNPLPHLYRGFILMRLGIYNNALIDLDQVLKTSIDFAARAHHLKARCFASLEKYSEALDEFELALKYERSTNKNLNKTREWFKNAAKSKGGFLSKLLTKEINSLIKEAEESLKLKEFWYTNWCLKQIKTNNVSVDVIKKIKILELELMYSLFQFKNAIQKANEIKAELKDDQQFQIIFNKLIKAEKQIGEAKREEIVANNLPKEKTNLSLSKKTELFCYDSKINVINVKVYDLHDELQSKERKFLLQFMQGEINYIGVEVIISNPFFNKGDGELKGEIIWCLNNEVIGSHQLNIQINSNWENVLFVDSWGSDDSDFWQAGQGKVEIKLDDHLVCERYFLIGDKKILNLEDYVSSSFTKQKEEMQKDKSEKSIIQEEQKPLKELLDELNHFVGMQTVKQAMNDFVDYLTFIKERKKLGLKTHEGISLHTVFIGNPGTGKTTVARILGKIFYAMGLLEKGHLVECDRVKLVGQYIGETAQKTDKLISDAIGGVLFIDEAYTLIKKGGSGQDFGQEAIDILLKRMEDQAGEFAVIVAGYPDEMNVFLDSNPGMKSRFTHFFNFEDYKPEELIEIFKIFSKKEDYSITPEGEELLKKEFTKLYRKRDKSFGNARLVKNNFNEIKIQLGKRYLKLDEKLKDKNALSFITDQDVAAIFESSNKKNYQVGIDEELLAANLNKLNNLIGLDRVKKDVNELVKLVKYYTMLGEDVQSKFSDHIVFTGNPGTGKTTVARIVSQIYAALGLLPKGHLVEADRQALVASFVGQTAEKTTALINASIGGTLFIDEAYTLSKGGDTSGSDFGKEAIETLLKRMEDDRGKFIVIAAGYTDEMKKFLDSNVGLQSRFTKFIHFEDYTPDELMTITSNLLSEKELHLDDVAADKLKNYYNELFRRRDKTFGNARLVRNIVQVIFRNQVLRIVDTPKENLTEDISKKIKLEDIHDLITPKPEAKEIKLIGDKELLDQHLQALTNLVGLDSVKKSVERLISSLRVAKLREEKGLVVIRKNLNSVFLGKSGTGKTTVARLISKIYKELGLLEKGHLIEIDTSALISNYQGQTAIKTEEIIKSALGGILFINEADALTRIVNGASKEAIETLAKKMNEYRDKLVVILAGFPNEMKDFFELNPGFQSKFENIFYFEDYSPREMLEIVSSIAEKSGYILDEGALQLFLEIFSNIYKRRDNNFGNAKTIKNIFYKVISNQEERILGLENPTIAELATITYEDLEKIDISEF